MPRPQGVSALSFGETETGWSDGTPDSQEEQAAWLALQPPDEVPKRHATGIHEGGL